MEPDLAAPGEQAFDIFEDLQEYVQTFARSHGYAVAIGRSRRNKRAALELRQLVESNGEQPPLWAEMEEFAGMTRATQAFRQSQRLAEKSMLEE